MPNPENTQAPISAAAAQTSDGSPGSPAPMTLGNPDDHAWLRQLDAAQLEAAGVPHYEAGGTEDTKREAVARWNRVPRGPQEAKGVPLPGSDNPERVERFRSQLLAVVEAKPRAEWPDAIEAMQQVITRVKGLTL